MTDFQHCRLHSNSWVGDAGCLVPSCLLEPRRGNLWFSGSSPNPHTVTFEEEAA